MSAIGPMMALQPSAYAGDTQDASSKVPPKRALLTQHDTLSHKNPLDLLLENRVAFVDARYPDDALAQINLEPINQPKKIDINTEDGPSAAFSDDQLPKELAEIVAEWPAGYTKPGGGFYNVGNTCYLNATLQALVHMPSFAHALVNEKMHPRSQCPLAERRKYCALCAMTALMSSSLFRTGAAEPSGFTSNLRLFAPGLRVGRQEDAHEFLRFVVDAMQNACLAVYPPAKLKAEPKLSEKTLIYQLFGGKIRSRVTCFSCHAVSDTFEDMLDLSLPLEDSMEHLYQSFDAFIQVDTLQGSNKYKCEKCKNLVRATKQLTLHQAPNILTIHLKRFTPLGRKLGVQIKYQEYIKVDPYMSDDSEPVWYRLDGIISHSGFGPSSGHYYSHIRAADKRWYRMDDATVSFISGGVTTLLSMRTAYILMYTRVATLHVPSADQEEEDQRRNAMSLDPQPSASRNPFASNKSDSSSMKRKDSDEPEESPVDTKRSRKDSDPLPFMSFLNGGDDDDGNSRPSSRASLTIPRMPGSYDNATPSTSFYASGSNNNKKLKNTYGKQRGSSRNENRSGWHSLNDTASSSSSDGEYRPGSSGSSSSSTSSASAASSVAGSPISEPKLFVTEGSPADEGPTVLAHQPGSAASTAAATSTSTSTADSEPAQSTSEQSRPVATAEPAGEASSLEPTA